MKLWKNVKTNYIIMVLHITQVDGESWEANYFGVGVGIGVGIEKVLFDPDSLERSASPIISFLRLFDAYHHGPRQLVVP